MGALAEVTIPAHKRWIPKGMEVSYTAKADSDITCIAETDPEQWTGDDPDVGVRVRGVRTDGTVVIEGTIRLWVTEKPERRRVSDDCRWIRACEVATARTRTASSGPQTARPPSMLPTRVSSIGFFSPTRRFCTMVAIQVRIRLTPDVEGGDHDRRGHLVAELLVDRLADRGEAGGQDVVAEAGVLERHDHLADDRRQHDLDALRQQHGGHHLRLAHADGVRRLALAGGHGVDAGPEDLRQDRPVVERQRDDDAPEGAERAAADGQQVEGEHHEQQHRHGAEELHDEPGRPADPGVVRQLGDAEERGRRRPRR